MTCALITHPDCLDHRPGDRHPESPARLEAVLAELDRAGLTRTWQRVEAPRVTRAQLERVHHPAYLDEVERVAPETGTYRLEADTVMSPGSLAAASRAAGAVVHAVDLAMGGAARSAFCATRPPGHHARAGEAMGFCIFGNLAVGAAHAMAEHGVTRIAIADFDVHRGNGTESMFRLEAADYRWLTHELRDIAEGSARGRIVSVLEGGYGLSSIGPAVAAHLMALGDCTH